MPTLHYAGQQISLTDDEAQDFLKQLDLHESATITHLLERGRVTFVTGPGIPILIDERTTAPSKVRRVR